MKHAVRIMQRVGMPAARWLRHVACSLLLVTVIVSCAQAQPTGDVVLAVETNADDAVVYVDSTFLGGANKRFFSVPSTAREIRLMAPYQASWSLRPVTARLPGATAGGTPPSAGDTVRVQALFPYSYRIESSPFGARVAHAAPGDTALVYLGLTPLTVVRQDPITGRLRVAKPGYEPVMIEPGADIWNRHSVSLAATGDMKVRPVAVEQPRRRRWIDALALGVAGSAAAVAVHYKFKADRRYDVYAENGDPTLRPAIRKLDVRSGIALGVMQAGLGVFAIRMTLR